jgi:hypothetical protein
MLCDPRESIIWGSTNSSRNDKGADPVVTSSRLKGRMSLVDNELTSL